MVSVTPVVGPERYELALELPVRRATASLNVRWEDKVVFDAVQAWLAFRKGRQVSQWEAFTFLLATALENVDSPLSSAALPLA